MRHGTRRTTSSGSLPLTENGLYYYLFQSRELSAKALVRFGLNEIWSYELISSDAQFSVLKGIVSSVAVFGGGALLAVSLIKLRRISSEIPKAQAGVRYVARGGRHSISNSIGTFLGLGPSGVNITSHESISGLPMIRPKSPLRFSATSNLAPPGTLTP